MLGGDALHRLKLISKTLQEKCILLQTLDELILALYCLGNIFINLILLSLMFEDVTCFDSFYIE